MFDLSIVIPTVNRADLLERNLVALRDGVACSHEIIVVDGASDDDTPKVLGRAKEHLGDRLTVRREQKREGFVRAANKGFAAAVGRNLMWLNDDSTAIPGALDQAVAQIDAADANVAFLAMFHHWHSMKNIAYETEHEGRLYRLCHIRGTLYANFPIGRRETFEKLGWFDERYFLYAADPDLSLKAWHAGMRVEPAYGVIIEHDQVDDGRRLLDVEQGREDNDKLLAKWDLPPKNPWHNDFDPANPCTLRGLRTVQIAAAA